jgi:hypothetical protein
MDDMYKFYSKNTLSKVDSKTYKSILKDLNLLIVKELLKGEDFCFPVTSDTLAVRKKKLRIPEKDIQKHLGVDYKTSNNRKKVIYHLNEHSDFFLSKFKWFKSRAARTTIKRWYSFTACRQLKGDLSKIMKNKEGHKLYFEYK